MSATTTSQFRLDKILEELLSDSSISDIHVAEGQPLWVRRNGQLIPMQDAPPVPGEGLVAFLKHKEKDTGYSFDAIEKAMSQKGDEDLAFSIKDSRFRANVFRANDRRLSMTLRRIPDQVPRIESLGLPPAFMSTIKQAKGLVLVTGATGSGKSTTLAAAISHLNETLEGHIVTIEDPVEYIIKSKKCLVHQRQVRRETKDFMGSLRAAMRQDPDVILVGELRDQETVKTALDAANTGHLVLATLHTMSARQSIERVLSFFPPEGREYISSVLSQVLLGVLSQSLLRKADGKGRVLAAELLINTATVKAAIRDNKPAMLFNAMDTGGKEGQLLLNRALKELVMKGAITRDEAKYYAYDTSNLDKELSGGR